MYRLTILSIWRNPLIFPLIAPLVHGSLSLTWNPSFLCGAIHVHPGPRLLVNWPPLPHSLFPPPTVPQSNYAPFYDDITTPTSLSSAQYVHTCILYILYICICAQCEHKKLENQNIFFTSEHHTYTWTKLYAQVNVQNVQTSRQMS